MSLWQIADDATTAFMVDFFGRLRAGQAQGTALAQTKRTLSRHPRFAHPRHWAGFVLYGG
jgi:CHAT domain-containing protein